MFLAGHWYTVRLNAPDAGRLAQRRARRVAAARSDPRAAAGRSATCGWTSASTFSEAPVGPPRLERAVGSGAAAVAFSMYPVDVADLMTISDAGEIMPPKSTWFEPKLRDGLLIHTI